MIMSDAPETPPQPEVPLSRNGNLFAFLGCRMFNIIGNHSLSVAIGWDVYQLTNDPLDLGLIGLAQFTPAFLLFLVAGMAADRFDRRNILIVCNVFLMIGVSIIGSLIWTGNATVPLILMVLLIHGTCRSFYHTSAQAILPNLVPRAQFPHAVAYMSSTHKAATLAGPALGGFLIAWGGDMVYVAIFCSYALSVVAALTIRKRLRVESPSPVTLETVTDGFRYVWKNKIVLGAISIDLVAVLFGGVMGLLPVFASDILHVGPEGLGVMRATPGAGALLVGLVLTQVPLTHHLGPFMFVSVFVFGTAIILFSLSTVFWLSLIALAIYGAADMISVNIRNLMIQLATPDNMRGRVSAINAVSINASNELGDFRAGTTAAVVGSIGAVLVGGVVTVSVAGLWWLLFPTMRRVDRIGDAADAAKQK